MNPDFWKNAGYVFGGLIGLPFTVLVWRTASFFGEFKNTMKTMTSFIKHATHRLDDHDRRIQRIENERRMEEKYEEEKLSRRHHARRMGDPPPADETLD